MKIPKALTVKSLGMPRYVWLGMMLVMVGIIAYIQYRNSLEAVEGEENTEPEIEDIGGGADAFYSGPTLGTGKWVADTGVSFLPGGGGRPMGTQITQGPPPIVSDPTNIIINAPVDNAGRMNKPCTKGKPTKKAPKGFHWACVNGNWKAVANKQKPSSNKPKPKCGKKPKKKLAKGYRYKCEGRSWKVVPIQPKKKRALYENGPDFIMSAPPFRRDGHRIDNAPTVRKVKRLNRG